MTNKIIKRKLRKSSKLYIWEQITNRYMQYRTVMSGAMMFGPMIKINR